jgi:hypothetical protein
MIIAIVLLVAASLQAWADGPQWELRTKDTVIRLAVENTPVLTTLGAATGSGVAHNWARSQPETALPDTVKIDDKKQPISWTYSGYKSAPNKISFTYRCNKPKLQLVSTWHAVASLPGPIEHEVTIKNNSGHDLIIYPTPTCDLALRAKNGGSLEHWWVEKTSGHVGDPGTHTDKMQPGYQKRLSCGPYSLSEAKRDELPWFNIQDTVAKQGIYGGIEFSGWTATDVSMSQGDRVGVSMGLRPWNNLLRSLIKTGTSLQYPPVFIGAYKGEVDDACNNLHRWVEKHLRPKMPFGVTPWLVNNSWGSGMVVDENLAKSMIDQSADLGIEIFHVDAGWYKNVGDWHSSPTKFPNGLEKTADYAHSKGLKFGLWVGWTQGGSVKTDSMESLNVFNPNQRNWFGGDLPADWHNWDFTGATVCLGCTDAKNWCLNDLRRMIKQYKLDLLEHDQVMVLDNCSREGHNHLPNDYTDVSRACAEGYYAIYDQLHKENPNLIFEDCVNGGRFLDFGVAKRTNYLCMTDDYDPLNLRKCFYDDSHAFPPSMLESYISDHRGQTIANFRFMLRSAMMGWCTIMMDMAQWTPEQRIAGKREFECYKTRLRPLIASANMYYVLPRPDGKVWDGVQYVDPGTGRGVLFAFRPDSDVSSQTVVFKGLKPGTTYVMEAMDGSAKGTYTGEQLMKTGLTVDLPEKNSSDLVFFHATR